MTRICPNCKAKLGGYDYYFCTSCGVQLPSDMVNHQASFSRVADFAVSSKVKFSTLANFQQLAIQSLKKINVKLTLLIIGGVVLVGAVIFVVWDKIGSSFFGGTGGQAGNMEKQVNFSKNVVEVPMNWESTTFGSQRIMEYVPFNAEIVVEGGDLDRFISEYSNFDKGYENLYKFLQPGVSQGPFEKHFVFFATSVSGKYAWSLIILSPGKSYPLSAEIVKQYNWLRFWKSDPILLVTPEESALTAVIDAKGKTDKNFTQTPIYASTRTSVPKVGKLLVFVTSPAAKEYFKTFSGAGGLSTELKVVVESIGSSKADYIVIL